MLTEALPKRVRYPQAGVEDAVFAGVVPINRLPRLAKALLDNGLDHESVPESVAAKLTFSSDGPARVLVLGEASFKQQWRCQRCLEAVELTSGSDIEMILSSHKKVIEQLGSDQDSLRTEGDLVDTADIIEDQLLLALPMSPKHEDCEPAFQVPDPIAERPASRPAKDDRDDRDDKDDEIEEGRQRPFAGLKRLTEKD
jgi:uncharacterized protein